jgi:hypothetical protein
VLDAAYTALEQAVQLSESAYLGNAEEYPAFLAARLLGLSEQLGPDRLAEDFDRALSLRPPYQASVLMYGPTYENTGRAYEDTDRQGIAGLAALLARYDTDTAQFVLDAYPQTSEQRDVTRNTLPDLRLEALIDPESAVARIEGIPVNADQDRDQVDWLRVGIAQILTFPDLLSENIRAYGLARDILWRLED